MRHSCPGAGPGWIQSEEQAGSAAAGRRPKAGGGRETRVGGAAIHVSVGVLTYRRPCELASLLPALVEQAHAVMGSGEYTVDIIVVDNDADASAASTVIPVADVHPLVRYVVEPTPGIAAARNRALDEASGSRLLAFVDDDERPDTDWLARLLDTCSATGAAAVAGRVLEEFATPPGPWFVAGEFFRRPRLPTGTPIGTAAAGNLLLDLDQVRAAGVRFDPTFALGGGEDNLFCRELTRAGFRIVWCDEARVFDRIPPARTTRRWVLARAYSDGHISALVDLRLADRPRVRSVVRARAVTKGLVRVPAGLARYAVGLATGSARLQARGLRTLCRGAGMLAAATGRTHEHYRRNEPDCRS